MFFRIQRMLLNAQSSDGGSSTTTEAGNGKVEPEVSLSRLAEKHDGNYRKVSEKLFDQTYTLRGRVRDQLHCPRPYTPQRSAASRWICMTG